MIDFSGLPLSPEQSRAARNYLGKSQAQTADESKLPIHKIKRFESGSYVPDTKFLRDLRQFYEGNGFEFTDDPAPTRKAKARGEVFSGGVVDGDDGTGGTSPAMRRPVSSTVYHMRISPDLETKQVDRIFDQIEGNEERLASISSQTVEEGFLADYSDRSQALHASAVRSLAEIGALFLKLIGRSLPETSPEIADGSQKPKTQGELLGRYLVGDLDRATAGDPQALARRKDRTQPKSVLEALFS